ncbi:hypothetical protein [Neisseria bacilliformis]|uniref:hypothetical protein n=1 Tax=Neisseria bacilliformis TaxID=267212 RepID=UPI0006695411|nr:hypothetical protein [Neisseria bacilliformis]
MTQTPAAVGANARRPPTAPAGKKSGLLWHNAPLAPAPPFAVRAHGRGRLKPVCGRRTKPVPLPFSGADFPPRRPGSPRGRLKNTESIPK